MDETARESAMATPNDFDPAAGLQPPGAPPAPVWSALFGWTEMRSRLCLLLFALIFILSYLNQCAQETYLQVPDECQNASMARSLLAGKGWLVNYVGWYYFPPPNGAAPDTHFTLVMPTLIAAATALLGENGFGWYLPNLAVILCLAVLIRHIVTRLSTWAAGDISALVFLLSQGMGNNTVNARSNTLSVFLILLYVYLLSSLQPSWTKVVISGIVGGLVLLARTENCIVMAVVLLSMALWQARANPRGGRMKEILRTTAPSAGVSFLVFLPFLIRNILTFKSVYPPTGYFVHLPYRYLGGAEGPYECAMRIGKPYTYGEVAGLLGGPVALVRRELLAWYSFLEGFARDYYPFFIATCLALVLISWQGEAQRLRRFTHLAVAGLAALLLFMAAFHIYTARYFYLWVPVAVVLFGSAAGLIWRRLPALLARRLAAAMAVTLLVSAVIVTARMAVGAFGARPFRVPDSLAWTRENTRPDDTIMMRLPMVLSYNADRRVVAMPLLSVDEILEAARLTGARYAIVETRFVQDFPATRALAAGQYPPHKIALIHESAEIIVYAFR
jgi:hypothetical protein